MHDAICVSYAIDCPLIFQFAGNLKHNTCLSRTTDVYTIYINLSLVFTDPLPNTFLNVKV